MIEDRQTHIIEAIAEMGLSEFLRETGIACERIVAWCQREADTQDPQVMLDIANWKQIAKMISECCAHSISIGAPFVRR
jgi:hypothetical protein